MNRYKVALTFTDSNPDVEEEILKDTADVIVSDRDIATEEELLAFANDAQAYILGTTEPVTRRVIERKHNLRVLARYGIGYDNVDVKAATDNNVVVINSPDFCLDEVADHALTLALTLTRRIMKTDRMMRAGKSGLEILNAVKPIHANSTLTFGLLGLGNIARRVATRAKALGFKVISYDPWVPRAEFGLLGVERVASLESFLGASDVVSVHVPLSPQTRHLLGERELGMMKRTAVIVNTSRGPVIDQKALYSSLEAGTLAGAGIDVFEVEPLDPGDPLRTLDNVVLTPHLAAYSEEASQRVRVDVCSNIRDALAGRRPANLVNPEVWGRQTGKAGQ